MNATEKISRAAVFGEGAPKPTPIRYQPHVRFPAFRSSLIDYDLTGLSRAAATFLTGVHPKKTAGADLQAGISADQIVAKHLGNATRLSSLELGFDDSRLVGSCDTGYRCAYTNTIVWRGPTSPLPPETNPRLVFERLFGTEDFSLDPATRARRAGYRKSILDISIRLVSAAALR